MKMILVSARHAVPISIDLASPATRLKLAVWLMAACLVCAGLGAGAAVWLLKPGRTTLVRVARMHAQVHQQRLQLGAIRADAQRQVNALTSRLGELQAQSLRLDALGERLTQMGHLDNGEFDFAQPPAVGGPENDDSVAYALPPTLEDGIRALDTRFQTQQAQLDILQELLLDHKVAADQRPTGMPLATGYISSYYGKRIDPFNGRSTFHAGLDLAAPKGTPVHAVAEGIVTYAGIRHGYGNVVEIDHGNGYMTRYAHNSKLLVHVGQRVHVGSVISLVGSTGRSTGPHCHFEVWLHGHTVNPLAYVRRTRNPIAAR
ncbi:MAG TPA: M23 family metallopeptidase [Rhodanobacteraceae bacterium]|nr:M23 family metallopeptidase [Rhodanobacteraceae bacterium]